MVVNFVSWLTRCDFVAYHCFSIAGGEIRQYSEISKQVRKLLAVISNSLDIMVWMVTCHRVPGPPVFLVNVENLGVAWGQTFYVFRFVCSCGQLHMPVACSKWRLVEGGTWCVWGVSIIGVIVASEASWELAAPPDLRS